jgi:hypothetical protein
MGLKKGNRIVTAVYIDPEDEYADVSTASSLCLGGAIKYKLKDTIASQITTDWLAENVVPNIAKRFTEDRMLFAALNDDISEDVA